VSSIRRACTGSWRPLQPSKSGRSGLRFPLLSCSPGNSATISNEAFSHHPQNRRGDRGWWGKWRNVMTTRLRKIESREIRELSTNELDTVTGGTSYPTLSLGGQSRVTLQQELTAA
jgi:bacteriocin-like protein